MKIVKRYRGNKTELEHFPAPVISKADNGGLELKGYVSWRNDNFMWHSVILEVGDLVNLRNEINQRLGDLAGVPLVTITEAELGILEGRERK